MKNPVPLLRKVGHIEAISTIALFFIAMPLKYLLDMPLAVRIVGTIHGALFVALCVLLLRTMIVAKWSLGRGLLFFLAAWVPFGPFVIDRRVKGYQEEFEQKQKAAAPLEPVAK